VLLYGAADQWYEAAGERIDEFDSIRRDVDINSLISAIGELRLSQLRHEGTRLTVEGALAVARAALGGADPQLASTRID
jgi:hypothetical protein